MSRPIFVDPNSKKEIAVSEKIFCEVESLRFVAPKTAGWNSGGWYANETGATFMVKFPHSSNPAFPYLEKLLNDLAEICVGEEFTAGKTGVGHGTVDEKPMLCLLTPKVENYRDLIDIKAPSGVEADSIALRKTYAEAFHRFYPFCALLGNDDLNEENFGVKTDPETGEITPLFIDYGSSPTFLNPEQIQYSTTPFHLASFTGHRNLNGMQLVRRRYFGHDDLLDPFQPKKFDTKPEDISYLSILDGVKKIIDARDEINSAVSASFARATSDELLTAAERESYAKKYAPLAEVLQSRISWMQENFAPDLAQLGDPEKREEFSKTKWRLHPKFSELMQFEDVAFKECAQTNLEENFANFSKLLEGRSRAEILALDLRTVEKTDLKDFAKQNFMLHNAILSGDFELVKWMSANDIGDVNSSRNLRTHNYQIFRTTPLHAAIASYHDKLFYRKFEELEPLREVIGILQEKFLAENGAALDESRDYVAEGASQFAVRMTFGALKKYQEQALPLNAKFDDSATKIQSAFRAHRAERLSGEEAAKGRD